MDPQKITDLANLLRNNGDKILNSEFTLTLSGTLLRALNDSFTLIADTVEIGAAETFQVVKPINHKSPVFRDLQLVHDFVQKTALLCIVHYAADDYFEGNIDISKFRTLRRLEVRKTKVLQIVGIQPLRAQLQELICVKSLNSVDDIITRCGGDNSNGFVWNELKVADFSYNNLQTIDTSLEFAQYLQHLNLRHNQLHSVEAIKWLPHLKTLDLSFNRLQCIPQFHMEACKRLQCLNMGNNFVEDLMGVAKLDALTDLDLSDNCLLDHSYLLPLSALLTLKFLNLYGNPLHCHPKHRLATAQFLHKNTATVKFILDFEPLSKNEKSITGSQQLRQVGALNRFTSRSSTTSISSHRRTPSTHTPASSVGSLRSFKYNESDTEAAAVLTEPIVAKKRAAKTRTVEIADKTDESNEQRSTTTATATKSVTESKTAPNKEHLEAKKHIETLREKYGAEWLQSNNAEMMQSVLGITSAANAQSTDEERNISRQRLNDFLGELSADTTVERSSTPTTTFIDKQTLLGADESTLFISMEQSQANNDETTLYKSAVDKSEMSALDTANDVEDDEPAHLKNVYATTIDNEPEFSDPEEDEETYIVYTPPRNEALFLTISGNFLRERDTLTQRTKTKWSLKILESCDLIKSNTLRINFDTVKADKQERVYTVEDGLCQQLEKQLRAILSQRDLTEMNQTIYRCVNCACQFSHENKKQQQQHLTIRCPDCKSTFVAEMHDISKSLEKATINSTAALKLSPAAIVEEAPIITPLVVQPGQASDNIAAAVYEEENNSIGKGSSTRLTAINTQQARNLMQTIKSSANSLNESSSCSKITNSQSSFDSNRSTVGSTTTERDNEFKTNCESDVDILSNPSQSSIEVLDQAENFVQRKISREERRSLQIPNVDAYDDYDLTPQTVIERQITDVRGSVEAAAEMAAKATIETKAPLAHFNLTESSSSGSVTDSICTAYEQQQQQLEKTPTLPAAEAEKIVINNMLAEEQRAQSGSHVNGSSNKKTAQKQPNEASPLKRADSSISNMFGALFQSTNLLMSSSKKFIEAEALPAAPASCKPYKFNYDDFNDVDHRLKLYFYQTKFEEQGEHFKWLARGRIYNAQTQMLCDGLIVMSTYKCYLMEAFAPEHDDVTQWLRQIASVTVNRLESITLLPWKIGLSFQVRDWGGFLLLLQDILRTDSLLLYFANNTLPEQCELQYQPATQLLQRLNNAVNAEQLKMFALLNSCVVTCEQAKRNLNICGLLTTDTRLYLTNDKFDWLTASADSELELCMTQFMSNLVDVERALPHVVTINFHDETQDKCELWQCTFETAQNADSCLNAIAQSWEQLFGVPLLAT